MWDEDSQASWVLCSILKMFHHLSVCSQYRYQVLSATRLGLQSVPDGLLLCFKLSIVMKNCTDNMTLRTNLLLDVNNIKLHTKKTPHPQPLWADLGLI